MSYQGNLKHSSLIIHNYLGIQHSSLNIRIFVGQTRMTLDMNAYIELHTPYDDDRPVFLAGDFCDWYPDVPEYALEKIKPGTYRFSVPPDWLEDRKSVV